jgi:hypothetical protein
MIQISENGKRLDIISPMGLGTRILFGLLSLIPLLAPYELIFSVNWTTYWHPYFLFAAIISAGALVVSGFLLFAAVAGINSRMIFDANHATFTYIQFAPIIRKQSRVFPLSLLDSVQVKTNDWSDGSPSYALVIKMADGTTFSSGSSWSREIIEKDKTRVEEFLASLK